MCSQIFNGRPSFGSESNATFVRILFHPYDDDDDDKCIFNPNYVHDIPL